MDSLLHRLEGTEQANQKFLYQLPGIFASLLHEKVVSIQPDLSRLSTGKSDAVNSQSVSPPRLPAKDSYFVPRILWITDNLSQDGPTGKVNRLLYNRLQQLPVIIDTISILTKAMGLLRSGPGYIGIVSDMFRIGNPAFGIELLDSLNHLQVKKPIFYFSLDADPVRKQVIVMNHLEISSDVDQAVRFVVSLLKNSSTQ